MKPKNVLSREKASTLRKLLLKKVFKPFANTKQKKLAMAQSLGLTVDGIESFIYEGRGSFDTWANAFLYRFDLSAEELLERLPTFFESLIEQKPKTRVDEILAELKEGLTERELLLSLLMIKASFLEASPKHRKKFLT